MEIGETSEPNVSADLRHKGRLPIGRKAATRRVGLLLAADTTLDEWRRIGHQIGVISDASGWWLGDWLIYGEEKYPGRYRQAIEETGLDYQTLRNYAWIARRFKIDRRRDKLSIQHHIEVAALAESEQDAWLDRAEHFSWSRNALRQQLKASRQTALGISTPQRVELKMEISSEQRQRWLLAAEKAQVALSDWISSALDRAAVSTEANGVG